MLNEQMQQAIRVAISNTFDALRGVADTSVFRDHFLALLLLKYLSDLAHSHSGEHDQWVIAKDSDFYALANARYETDVGNQIDKGLARLVSENPSLLGVFQGVSFDSTALGNPDQKKRVLSQLLTSFDVAALDFRSADELAASAVAFACDSLISQIAATSGKHGGEFFTPPELSLLIARLMRPEPGESICDPCCGSGTLLLTCGRIARKSPGHLGCNLYGQEKNGSTWALAKINMLLHGEHDAQLAWSDTLRDPRLIVDGRLQMFDVVVSSPPFNLKDWGYESAEQDSFGRYRRGIPPRAAGDYAFISHMVETLKPESGRMAVVVALGVLFRSGAEQQIRERLLHENLIDAVIALPAKMFPHTGIPVALLVLRKKKFDDRVLFIDASRDYQRGKTQNILREDDLARIECVYLARQDVDRYSRTVALEDILGNDSNLNVARYVDAATEIEAVDLAELSAERSNLMAELEALEAKLATLLKEVGHG